MKPIRWGQTGVMTSTTSPRAAGVRVKQETDEHRPKLALAGLVARGVLYLLLGITAVELTVGRSNERADSRSALHQFAGSGIGTVMLVVLTIGFVALALLNVHDAITAGKSDDAHPKRRLADVGRTALYGSLTVAAVSILVSGSSGGSSSQRSQTWTAKVLGWPGGQVLVGTVGAAIAIAGIVMIAKVCLGKRHDQASMDETAPREPGLVAKLGAFGYAARGVVNIIIGSFVLVAAVDFDPTESVGIDGALKRTLDEPYGDVLVVVIALGLAAYGVYSLARAWANRSAATT
jgi:hypothetical protein